jgi:hypothetical protein
LRKRRFVMWRLIVVLVAFAALVALATSHRVAYAQQGTVPEHKQLICHVSDDVGAHIIEVGDPAVPAHLRNHGDCLINSTNRALIGEPCNPTDANNNDICDIQP